MPEHNLYESMRTDEAAESIRLAAAAGVWHALRR